MQNSILKKSLIALAAAVSLSGQVYASGADRIVSSLRKEIALVSSLNVKTREFMKKVITPFCTNSVFIEEVRLQNSKKQTIQKIKQIDKKWIEAEDELPIHRRLTSNNAAKEIRRLISENPSIIEAFLMDDQGANVGQNSLTSDYWQGDEAKWQKAFNDGKGGLYIGKQKFDKSANQFLQQISVPVITPDGSVIGAFCAGINTSRL